eukprot:TCALIF_03458-PA protein Name:"Similar to pol Retrovirus-related Pol polyprotein from transposon opus (Drosophila melanogaster)" AED:0.06 eAED:0.10 QI:61/0/0/1/0/0.16/6/0/1068
MCTQKPYDMNPKDPTSSGSTKAQAADMQDDNWALTNGSFDTIWTTTLPAEGMAIPSVFFDMFFSNVFNTGTLDMAQVVIKVKTQPSVGATLCFLPDSGANITAIPQDEFVAFGGKLSCLRDNNPPPLLHRWLTDPDMVGLSVALLHFPPSSCHEERKVWIINGLRSPVLSRASCFALDILTSKYLLGGNLNHLTSISNLDTTTQPLMSTLATLYPKALSGKCGIMEGEEVTAKLCPNAKPITTYSNRPIPINLKQAFEDKLQEQLAMGILEPAEDENSPGEWLNPMVVTWKKNAKKAWITADVRELNKATIRPTYYGAAPLHGGLQHSNLCPIFHHGLKGFHQIVLSPASRWLTTFVTPMGRYRYRRMPMGWHGSSDVFNSRMSWALKDVPNVGRVVEDMIIYTDTLELQACEEASISINTNKVQFCQTHVSFGGYLVSRGQYRIDPSLTIDLREFPTPKNRTELRSILGLAQQLGNSTHEITCLIEPLRTLNSDKNLWAWLPHHQSAFNDTRRAPLVPNTCLDFTLAAAQNYWWMHHDAMGLDFYSDNGTKPTITGALSNAAHELLPHMKPTGPVWQSWRCWGPHGQHKYVTGLAHFTIVTDSNPLVPILNDKRLDQVTNDRVLKLKMMLSCFNFTTRHQQGSLHVIPDAFSRSPHNFPETKDLLLTPEDDSDRELIINAANNYLTPDLNQNNPSEQICPDARLEAIRSEGNKHPTYATLKATMRDGWPKSKQSLPNGLLQPYYKHRTDLYEHNGLILFGPRLLIPESLQRKMLQHLHSAHQGITKTSSRAERSVWWSSINHDILQAVQRCQTCQERLPSHAPKPLQHIPKASQPFEKMHADIFEANGKHYLVTTDEFTGWPSLACIHNMTSHTLINSFRTIFLATRVPNTLQLDNAPQFVLLQEALPMHPIAHDPQWRRPVQELDEIAQSQKAKLRANYDQHTCPLHTLAEGTPVMIQDPTTKRWTGQEYVIQTLSKHDYIIKQECGRTIQRKRVLLRVRHFTTPIKQKSPLPVEQSHQENNNPLPITPLPTLRGALEDPINVPKPLTPPSWAKVTSKHTLPFKLS